MPKIITDKKIAADLKKVLAQYEALRLEVNNNLPIKKHLERYRKNIHDSRALLNVLSKYHKDKKFLELYAQAAELDARFEKEIQLFNRDFEQSIKTLSALETALDKA
jgi:hypothetical protein